MWGSQDWWNEWFPVIGATVLFLLLLVSVRKRKVPVSNRPPTLQIAEDLPPVRTEWQRDVCVFDEPEKFGYCVYTSEHDCTAEAVSIPLKRGAEERRQLLSRHIGLNAEATSRLAARLRERGIGAATGAVILVDHSGSLKRRAGTGPDDAPTGEPTGLGDDVVGDDSGAAFAAGIAVSMALALEECGASTELLGFTTREWKGGQSRRDWRAAGRPPYPGRLNDLLHIIYKRADEPSVAECSDRLESFLHPPSLKENIDGEAIAWARGRLLAQSVSDRLLIVLSDGASVDDSTLQANGLRYLYRHLVRTITDIERRQDLRIVGIGIGFDVSQYYSRSESAGLNEQEFADRIDVIAELISGSNTEGS